MNSKIFPLIVLFIFNHFQVYQHHVIVSGIYVYVLSIPFKNSCDFIGIFGDTFIVGDYN